MSKTPENTINGLPGDHEVESRARTIFKSACEGTDSYHALRLGLARRKALNAGARHTALRVWAPLVGAAACCALVVGLVWMRPASPVASGGSVASSMPVTANPNEDDEVIPEVSSEQMEMVQNLDFYRWLATQPAVASAPTGGGR